MGARLPSRSPHANLLGRGSFVAFYVSEKNMTTIGGSITTRTVSETSLECV
jgi:hypothetical protein